MTRASALLLAALLVACAGLKAGDAPRLRLGADACARCGMIVSDEKFAAGYVSDEGESVVFDDLGELLAALDESPALRPRAWVRDLNGTGWVRLAEAKTVRGAGVGTPMGTGWVAFAKPADAEAFTKARSRSER